MSSADGLQYVLPRGAIAGVEGAVAVDQGDEAFSERDGQPQQDRLVHGAAPVGHGDRRVAASSGACDRSRRSEQFVESVDQRRGGVEGRDLSGCEACRHRRDHRCGDGAALGTQHGPAGSARARLDVSRLLVKERIGTTPSAPFHAHRMRARR